MISDPTSFEIGNRIVINNQVSYLIRFINPSWSREGVEACAGHLYLTLQNEHPPHNWMLVESHGTAKLTPVVPC